MAYIIGRGRYARETYPEPKGSGGGGAFARNFASGTGGDSPTPISSAGTQLPWSAIDVGAPGVDVTITPQSSGVIRVSAVISVENEHAGPEDVSIQVQVDDVTVPVPLDLIYTFAGQGTVAVPVLAEITGLTIGAPITIQILAAADSDGHLVFVERSSTIEVQEVPVATG